MSSSSEVIKALRDRKAILESELHKVSLALDAMQEESKIIRHREKKTEILCVNNKHRECKRVFKSARRDAKFCPQFCGDYVRKHGITLVEGAK